MNLRTGGTAPLAIAVVTILCGGVGAQAAPIAFQFSTTIDATVIGGSPVAPFVLTYIFDSGLTNSDVLPNPSSATYEPISGMLQLGPDTVMDRRRTSKPADGLRPRGSPDVDAYLVRFGSPGSPSPVSGTIGGHNVLHVYSFLHDDDATMFGNTSLPVSPAFASEVDHISVEVWLGDDPMAPPDAELHISPAAPLKSFSLVQLPVSVPEPGVAVLVGVAVAGLAARRRRAGQYGR